MLNQQFARLVHRVSSCHSFAAPSAPRDEKVTFDKVPESPPTPPVKPAAGASSSKPPWKGKVASVKKALLPPDEDLLDFSEVLSSSSSSFPFALNDSGSAVHTSPTPSFLIDPISSFAPIRTQLTAANGTIIPSMTIISGKISPTLYLTEPKGSENVSKQNR